MAHICNHCEDFNKPVTPENGISLKYPVENQPDGLELDLYLHDACAEAWSLAFDIPVPARSVCPHAAQLTGMNICHAVSL
jgi:hypothetical protein